MRPLLAVAFVHVAVPVLLNVRNVISLKPSPLNTIPPLAVVLPVPVIVPPVHVNKPVEVKLCVPAIVPLPDRFTVENVTAAALLKSTVPLLTDNVVGVLLILPVKLATPPFTVVDVLAV
jgi:hypothetical protein